MYGLVNQAILELVTQNFGNDTWLRIKRAAGVEQEYFAATDVYEDSVTYNLVGAASKELGLSPEQVLKTFGEFWVKHVENEGFGTLLSASGDSLEEFLMNLDQFHSRLAMNYPKFQPPSFECDQTEDGRVQLSYFSDRPGLSPMLFGIIHGMAKRYGTTAEIEVVKEDDHTKFLVAVGS